jgi:hypothetical protein
LFIYPETRLQEKILLNNIQITVLAIGVDRRGNCTNTGMKLTVVENHGLAASSAVNRAGKHITGSKCEYLD